MRELGESITGWRRLIGSPKLQIIFYERATKYTSLLRKMTYKDKGSYESSPPCMKYFDMTYFVCDMNHFICDMTHSYVADFSRIKSCHAFMGDMGWLWLVGSMRLLVSFAQEPCKRDAILQKRPVILSILLTVATP